MSAHTMSKSGFPLSKFQEGENYNPIEHVKRLRAIYKDLEAELRDLKFIVGQSEAGRYASLALTETESSRHWLGETLGALDVESPYKA